METSLQRGLGLDLLLLILIPVVLFSTVSLMFLNSILTRQLERNQNSIFHLIENSIRESIENPIDQLEEIIDLHNKDLLKNESFDEFLQLKVEKNPLFLSIYVLDKRGKLVHAPVTQQQEIGNDYSQFPFFTNISSGKDFYWSSTFMSTVFSEITYAFSLRGDNGQVYVGFYSLDSLQEMLMKLNSSEDERVSIINDSRFYLASSSRDLVEQRAQELTLDLSKKSQVIEMDGYKEIVHISFLSDLNLYVLRYLDFLKYNQPLISVFAVNLSMLVIILFLIIAYTRTQSIRISSHIQSLISGSNQIAQGNYQVEIDVSQYRELNILADNFKAMAERIRLSMEDQRHLNHTLKEQIRLVRESEGQLQLLMDFSYDGIVFLNRERDIIRISQSARKFFDLQDNDTVLGKKCYHALIGTNNICGECLVDQSLNSCETHYVTKELKGRQIEETSIPILSEHKEITGIIMTYRDVTEKKELERKLNRAIKLEAVGRFAGGIAHDFNNILQIIFGYTELLAQPVSEKEKKMYLESIHTTAEKAESLVKQLMAFCRLEKKRKEPVVFDRMLEDAIGMLDRLINDNYTLKKDLNAGAGKIKAEKNQIEQILMNLVVNARDSMKTKGTIILRSGKIHRGNRNFLFLEVEDHGTGIPEEIKEKIFDPFFTTKKIGEGSGLGLATVFGIVEGHEGLLELESVVGKGSIFRILIPEYTGD